MTVSLALRNDPQIPPARRAQIQEMARRMGYRPNVAAATLARHKRTAGAVPVQAALAWLNRWPRARELRGFAAFDCYWRGSYEAAEKFGYRLEEFVCNEQIPMRRLEKILRTRSVNGILIPPHPVLTNWSEFHCSNAVLAFEKIRARGYRRIGYLTGRRVQQGGGLASGFFKAGFLLAQSEAHDELPPLPPLELREEGNGSDEKRLKQWMKQCRPDAILTDVAAAGELVAAAGYRVPEDVGLAVLSILDGNADAGIDQNPEEIGRVAVLLAVSLINDGARGVPPIFRQILIAGEWVDGKSLPAR